MDEDEWWVTYADKLRSLPITGDDPVALTWLLSIAGFYRPRNGIPRPSQLDPARTAKAHWRLTFVHSGLAEDPEETTAAEAPEGASDD